MRERVSRSGERIGIRWGSVFFPCPVRASGSAGAQGDETAGRTKGREGGGIFGGRVEVRF